MALRFRNPTFRHGRLPSGAEELKHVEVVRKHSDGTFQSFASPGGLHPCASFHDVNLEWNPGLGEDPKLKRSATNPNFLSAASQHGGGMIGAGISQRSDLDQASSSARSGGGSPPDQSSMEEEEDEIGGAEKVAIGPRARRGIYIPEGKWKKNSEQK